MQSLENVFNTYDLSDMYELSGETPIGWSSTCLDQTISYYIDCNTTITQYKEKEEHTE
uniref:Uncharacterized protein n=1 Tax=Schimmelmannia schousboei TaxID=173468 RepID=A0A1C9C8N8_9FLOR|nr:hypothetical protein Schim_060 [Schimmelmannia schousboei]AOM64741.1 hypothetical protein Schim_060 [Schimmelmannia schousboei]